MSNKQIKKRCRYKRLNYMSALFYLIIILVIISFLIRLDLAISAPLDPDELQIVQSSWLVFNGELPYIDFFEFHTPLCFYIYGSIIQIFGESIGTLFILRYSVFVMMLIFFYFFYRAISALYDKDTAIISLLLLSFCLDFVRDTVLITSDVPMFMFMMIGLFFFVKGMRLCKYSYYMVSGLFLALAYLSKQTAIFIAFALIATALLLKNRKKILAYFLGSFVLPVIIFGLLLYAYSAIENFFTFTVSNISKINLGCYLFEGDVLMQSFLSNAFLWILGLALFIFAGYRLIMVKYRKKSNALVIITILSMFILLSIGGLRDKNLVMIPIFLSIIVAKYLVQITSSDYYHKSYTYFMIILFVISSLIIPGALLVSVDNAELKTQIDGLSMILDKTPKEAKILGSCNTNPLFRKPATYFQYMVDWDCQDINIAGVDISDHVLQDIRESKPEYIILNRDTEDLMQKSAELSEFIDDNFEMFIEHEYFDLLKRKD